MDETRTTNVLDEIDRLIHDAEHAEGGAEFATRIYPDPKAARELAAKGARLRERARKLAEKHDVPLCTHGYIAERCDLCDTHDPWEGVDDA